MCGIVGIYTYGAGAPPVNERELLLIRDAMVRRGPDAAGLWLADDRRVGFGHRRLSIIDLSAAGNQPMVVARSGTRITFNGEIYNYRELRATLEQRGHVFHTDSDTEVLLQAYDEYGHDMVDHLRGMYAFAIWDEGRHGLFLARDPFGIKPLYYADDGKTFTVASQVKALLAAPRIGRTQCPAGLVSFLTWGFVVEPYTLYGEIRALPAGSTLWVDGQGARKPAEYWSVGDVFRQAELARENARPPAVPARHETLRAALVESLRYHMVSDVPVGVFLSGGLDSATMVALASEEDLGDLRTLTLGFDVLRGTPADEVVFASDIAAAYGARHTTQWIGADKFQAERGRILAAMDQPSIDGANVYFVSQVAATAGVKVALSGLGGDELFGGYPSFRQVPRIAASFAPVASIPGFGRGFRAVAAPVLRQFTSPKYASLFEFGTSIEDAYLLRRGLFLPWELPQLVDADLAAEGWRELAVKARLAGVVANVANPHAKVAALEMSVYMRNQLLRDSDWAGMAHSVEVRVPFVDAALLRQLAPFVIGDSPVTKADLVATLRTPLPRHILNRPKSGFTVPIRDWLMRDQPARSRDPARGLRGWAQYVLARSA
ncbi:MAG TPA: asparagine synthase (glutamine-hydrolyzing) [Candidatus Binataceae bacterium]|nr:asparagine synthase (glutamine-hydrolyzing) [Candidatus Binataceae bacterium]